MDKRRKKAWVAAPHCILLTVWWERKKFVFDNVNMSINRMKTFFLSNLMSWANLYIVERPRSLVDFLTWLGCR